MAQEEFKELSKKVTELYEEVKSKECSIFCVISKDDSVRTALYGNSMNIVTAIATALIDDKDKKKILKEAILLAALHENEN